MSDSFFDQLRADWTAQNTDVASALARIRRQRWRPWLALVREICGYAVALLAGAFFVLLALQSEDQRPLYVLSAGALLVLPPSFAVVQLLIRRRALTWADETPEALLRVGLRRAEVTLRLNRMNSRGIAALCAFVLVLWAAKWAGMFEAHDFFLIVYTSACVVASLCVWHWSRTAAKCARRDRDIYAQLLRDYDES